MHKSSQLIHAASDALRCCYCSHLISANDDAQRVSKQQYAHTACAFAADEAFFAARDADEEQVAEKVAAEEVESGSK